MDLETIKKFEKDNNINISQRIYWTDTIYIELILYSNYVPENICKDYGDVTILLSPDVADKAAKDDFDTALLLLEGKNYDVFFPFYDKSYQIYRQFEWIDFLYCFLGYKEQIFLQKAHKSKRLCKYWEKILEKMSHSAVKTNDFINRSHCPDFSIFENISLQQKHLLRFARVRDCVRGMNKTRTTLCLFIWQMKIWDAEQHFVLNH